jgi:integrase
LTALRRRQIDLDKQTVTVVEQALELAGGHIVVGPPKSDAGRRVVAIPTKLASELSEHLASYVAPGPDSLVFTGEKGAPLRRANWNLKWRAAVAECGIEGLHFHDLRHTGNTFAAATGASTKELMARMGHASPRAALIYQHATAEREHAIADALNEVFVVGNR